MVKGGVSMKAKDIMTPNVITVSKSDSVEKAIKLLLEHNITGLPVVDEAGHVIGIITEGDLMYRGGEIKPPRYLAIFDSYIFIDNPSKFEKQLKKMTGMFVGDVMTTPVIVIEAEQSVPDAANLMTKHKVNRLPVIEEGKLVGIISRRDIIKSYASMA